MTVNRLNKGDVVKQDRHFVWSHRRSTKCFGTNKSKICKVEHITIRSCTIDTSVSNLVELSYTYRIRRH